MCLSSTLLYFLFERVNLCCNFVSLIVVNDSVKNAGTGFGICSRIFVFGVWVILWMYHRLFGPGDDCMRNVRPAYC